MTSNTSGKWIKQQNIIYRYLILRIKRRQLEQQQLLGVLLRRPNPSCSPKNIFLGHQFPFPPTLLPLLFFFSIFIRSSLFFFFFKAFLVFFCLAKVSFRNFTRQLYAFFSFFFLFTQLLLSLLSLSNSL